ncbi:hypothetical protein HYALB_00013878 [Hymenoscyphus albidus]|uniref:Uncharacterized protein n=1 Tax=Hymenoscyphus albidus TaxID=595503 RepID=A0A9N9Q0F8_9HELO|nr:hypothetical protein HYALB_00013878 [Hymenoscyphus albidus]
MVDLYRSAYEAAQVPPNLAKIANTNEVFLNNLENIAEPLKTNSVALENLDVLPEALWDLYYYSPAVSCPIGWAIAGTAKNTFGGVDSTYLTIGLETTAVLCCPSYVYGFTSKDFNHQCGSSFPAGQNTISYRAPVLKNGNWDIPRDLSTVYRTITGTGDWTVFGDGIPIWFQSSDKVAFTASKTSSTTSPTSTSVISSLTTTSLPTTSPLVPVPENSTDSAQASSRLSTGAKAGIGIGVALGVLGLAAIVAFFLYKCRQRATYNDVKRRDLPGHDPKSSPVHDLESYRGTIHSELSGQDQQVVHDLPDGAGNQRLMDNYKYPRT